MFEIDESADPIRDVQTAIEHIQRNVQQVHICRYVHPTAIVNTSMSRIRHPDLVDVHERAIIDDHCYISAALTLGAYSHIGHCVTILGGRAASLVVGEFAGIAPGCRLACASPDYKDEIVCAEPPPGERPASHIVIGDFCAIGLNSVVLPGVVLPEGCAFGAGSIISPKMNCLLEPWTVSQMQGRSRDRVYRRNKDAVLRQRDAILARFAEEDQA